MDIFFLTLRPVLVIEVNDLTYNRNTAEGSRAVVEFLISIL
jgi:hypothetical protein